MAVHVLTNVAVFLAQFELSGKLNACNLQVASELQDATTFGQTTRINKGGLAMVTAEHQGYWDSDGTDEPDDIVFPRIGTADVPMTIAPQGAATVGDRAFLFRSIASEYEVGGEIGSMLPFRVGAQGSGGESLARGVILHPSAARTATGNGTSHNFGAIAAGKTLYGALHVLAASGTNPTLDVEVESDTATGFPSAVTQLTFGQQTAVGSDWQSAAGALTDSWLRITYTIGGTNPSFTFLVAIGIA